MTEPSAALGREFGERLAVVGLQGSMRRGEATATSDIDILIVLDHLHAADVLRCRTVLDELPEGSRAHGRERHADGGIAATRAELLELARPDEAKLLTSGESAVVGALMEWAGAQLQQL